MQNTALTEHWDWSSLHERKEKVSPVVRRAQDQRDPVLRGLPERTPHDLYQGEIFHREWCHRG